MAEPSRASRESMTLSWELPHLGQRMAEVGWGCVTVLPRLREGKLFVIRAFTRRFS
jgi:hypothetical protein